MARQAATDFFADSLARIPAMAILRGAGAVEAVGVAEACWDAGIPLVEVSLSGDDALATLEAVCERARDVGRSAGAGTVLTPGQVRDAAAAGAAFAVAPGLDPDTVAAARDRQLPYLPGVATPSEVQQALALGCRTLKLFPASTLGTEWLRSLAGPFPEARFVAVGGIDAESASDWLEAGALAVGVGSALSAATLPRLIAALAR
ncbi:MAG TPA: bifunctional 4-hydroxy-2-oxoglutarate aldolase/2-dehydro-3-deoxy-phosphogluconate aldolase [Gaiellaceae bacterium]|nr:bifunctional 4-hydroxy-2-oxoglutarate aldolase/2-dehydro-3-deoxy-phosphogluconate aldolase [Gaiellaceae bacterium]